METLTFPALAGVLAVAAGWVLDRLGWSGPAKRWAVIGLAVGLCVLGMVAASAPHAWEQVAAQATAAVGVAQVVYAAFKAAGLLGSEPGRHEAVEGGVG